MGTNPFGIWEKHGQVPIPGPVQSSFSPKSCCFQMLSSLIASKPNFLRVRIWIPNQGHAAVFTFPKGPQYISSILRQLPVSLMPWTVNMLPFLVKRAERLGTFLVAWSLKCQILSSGCQTFSPKTACMPTPCLVGATVPGTPEFSDEYPGASPSCHCQLLNHGETNK